MKLYILLLLLLTLISCNNAKIEGNVYNGFGKPLKGAKVKIQGTQFESETNSDGEYSIGYVPGNIKVEISKPGYTDTSFSVNIAAKAVYPAASVAIYEIPKEKGLFFIDGEQYKNLFKATINKQNLSSDWLGMEQADIYSADYSDADIVKIQKKDSLLFLDYEPQIPITLLKIDKKNSSNIFLKRVTSGGGAGFIMGDYRDYGQFIKGIYKDLGQNIGLRIVNLDKGDYVFVPYKRGASSIEGTLYAFRVE